MYLTNPTRPPCLISSTNTQLNPALIIYQDRPISMPNAQGSVNLGVSGLYTTQRLSLTVGQIVHSLEADIEAGRGGVNSQYGDRLVDSIASVVHLVAFAAVGASDWLDVATVVLVPPSVPTLESLQQQQQ